MINIRQLLSRPALGAYIAVVFSLLSIVLTLILVEVLGQDATRARKATIGNGLAELAQQISDKLDRGMFERYREVQLLAQRSDLGNAAMAPEAKRQVLLSLQASFPYYAWIGMTDKQGKVLVGVKGVLEGVDVSERPWFKNAYRGIYLGDVHDAKLLASFLPPGAGEPPRLLDVAFPYRDAGGEVAGVLGAHLSWQWAREMEQSIIEPVARRRQVEALIVARDGTVLIGPPALYGKMLRQKSFDMAQSGRNDFLIEAWPDQRDYFVGYSKDKGYASYPGLGWTVLVRQDADSAFASVRQIQNKVLATGMLIAGVFCLIGLFAARSITRPIWSLVRSAQRIEAGQSAEVALPRHAHYEVTALTGAFNSLLRNLRTKEADLKELNATLERRVSQRTAELAQALQSVRQNERRIATIIESAQDAFIGMDLQGHITDWNSQAEALLGWRREEVIGQPLAQVAVPERYQDSFAKAIKLYRQQREAPFINQRFERLVLNRRREEIMVEMTIGLIDSHNSHFFGAFLHDISERKKIERMKSEFVSTVSHELRTPLTAIRGTLGLLSSGTAGALPPQAQSLVEIASKSSERLARLINDILDIEKIEAGTMQMQLRAQPLLPLLRQAIEAMQAYAAQLDVGLDLAPDAGDAVVAVDSDRINQVMINLLSNAVKFSLPGSRVAITATRRAGAIRVAVTDTGDGIPEAFRSRIFGRFAQVDSSDSRKNGGTGLGLSICKNIIAVHGGRIDFDSEVGHGSTFYFELPLVPDTAV